VRGRSSASAGRLYLFSLSLRHANSSSTSPSAAQISFTASGFTNEVGGGVLWGLCGFSGTRTVHTSAFPNAGRLR
jgi:hypothetical protein